MGDLSRQPTFARFALLAALGLAVFALVMWSGLPPVHQDEYMPLFPMTWFQKEPAARSGVLAAYSTRVFGHLVPVLAYPYLGAVKAYVYTATLLPTTIPVYRVAKLVLVWALFAIVLRACWRMSNGSRLATTACLALLLADIALVTLGVADAGNEMVNLTLGSTLLLALYSVVVSPRVWKIVPIALVVFVGEWDRVNFLWFLSAGLAGCVAAALADRPRRAVAVLAICIAGSALGLAGVARLLPQYPAMVWSGAQRSIPMRDLPAFWQHWLLLFPRVDPFAAYHTYVNTASPSHGELYRVYRWSWVLLYVAVLVACAGVGLARRRRDPARARALLFLAAYMSALPFLVLKTKESWASHHVLILRPFLYLGMGLLGAQASGIRWRNTFVLALAVLVVVWGSIGVLGFREMEAAPPILGIYDVSSDQAQAWHAASEVPVTAVYALDWGVFYPGVVNSPAAQRWEMPTIDRPEALRTLDAARKGLDMALLFQTKGPRRWLIESADARERYAIKEQHDFAAQKGEPWTLLVVNAAEWPKLATGGPGADTAVNLVRNGDFFDGTLAWQYEKWETQPAGALLTVQRCEVDGAVRPCVQLEHRAAADSRLVQMVALAPRVIYEVSAWGKATGVGEGLKGAHLVLLDHYVAESEELHGVTGWKRLHFYVVNLDDTPREVRLAGRLGTWGSLNTGSAWFADISVRPVPAPAAGIPVYEIHGET